MDRTLRALLTLYALSLPCQQAVARGRGRAYNVAVIVYLPVRFVSWRMITAGWVVMYHVYDCPVWFSSRNTC